MNTSAFSGRIRQFVAFLLPLLAIGRSPASTELGFEANARLSYSTGVYSYTWEDDTRVTRTLDRPAVDRITGDRISDYQLTGNQITISSPGVSRQPFWTSPTALKDIFLSGSHLIAIREGAAPLVLDRFTAADLGAIGDRTDLASFDWFASPAGQLLYGIKTDTGLATLLTINAAERKLQPEISFPPARPITNDFKLWPTTGEQSLWMSDGTLRNTASGQIITDFGQEITAAAAITTDLHLVANDRDLSLLKNDGTVLATKRFLRTVAGLFVHRDQICVILSNGAASLLEIPTWTGAALAPVLPPETHSAFEPNTFQMLPDGRVLMGSTNTSTATFWSVEDGNYTSGIVTPEPGEVAAFPQINRIGHFARSSGKRPHFGDLTATPNWVLASDPGVGSDNPSVRVATDDSWIHFYGSSQSPQARRFDAQTGYTSQAYVSPDGFKGPAVWNPASKTMFGFSHTGKLQSYFFAPSRTIVTSMPRDIVLAYHNPSFLRCSPSNRQIVDQESHWLNYPPRPAGRFDNEIDDATWIDDTLYSIRETTTGTCLIEKRDGALMLPSDAYSFPGKPLRLLTHDSQIVAVFSHEDRIGYLHLDRDLNPLIGSTFLPTPPKNLSLGIRTLTSLEVTWSPSVPDTNDGLILEYRRALSTEQPWLIAATLPPDIASHTVTGLRAAQQYEFRIRASRLATTISSSTFLASTRSSTGIFDGSPYDLRLISSSNQGVVLEWLDHNEDEEGFVILKYPPGSPEPTQILLPPNTTTFTDNDIAAGGTFQYQVAAFDKDAEGIASTSVFASTSDGPPIPGSPPSPDVRLSSLGWVWISWKHQIDFRREAFAVERKPNESEVWERLDTLPPDATNYFDTSAPFVGNSSYRLVAINTNGESQGNTAWTEHPKSGDRGFDPPAQVGRIVYAFVPHANRVKRFDLDSGTWLDDISVSLPEITRHFHAGPEGLFFASDYTVYRTPLTGGATETAYLSNSDEKVKSIWTSGRYLHVARTVGLNSSIYTNLANPRGVVIAPFITNLAVAPDEVTTSKDGKRVYGTQGQYSDVVMLFNETSTGRFSIESFRYSAGRTHPDRLIELPSKAQAIDEDGYAYRLPDLDPIGRVTSPFDWAAEAPNRHLLSLAGGQLTAHNSSFDIVGSMAALNGDAAAVIDDELAWIFSINADDPEFWVTRSVELTTLGITAGSNGPETLGEPASTFLDSQQRLWMLYQELGLLIAIDPRTSTQLHRFTLDKNPRVGLFDESRQTLAILLKDVSFKTYISLWDLSDPAPEPQEFQTINSAHSIGWTQEGLLTSSTSASQTYSSDGSVITSGPGTRFPFFSQWDDTNQVTYQTTNEFGLIGFKALGTNLGSYQELSVSGSTSNLFDSFARGNPTGRKAFHSSGVIGALDAVYGPAKAIRTGVVSTADAVWQGMNLYVLDQSANGWFWVVAFDGDTGREISRIPMAGTAISLDLFDDDHLVMASLDPFGELKITHLSSDLNPIASPTAQPPSLDFIEHTVCFVEGEPLDLSPMISGEAPFTYRWFRDGVEVANGSDPALRRTAPSPATPGVFNYRLEISNRLGTAASEDLSVAIIDRRFTKFTPGNLIIFEDNVIREVTRQGVTIQELKLPGEAEDPQSASIDSMGRIHLLDWSEFRNSHTLFTYRPDLDSWVIKRSRIPASNASGDPGAPFLLNSRYARYRSYSLDLRTSALRKAYNMPDRMCGPYFASFRGWEDGLGMETEEQPTYRNLYANGWQITPSGNHLVASHIRSARMNFIPIPNWVSQMDSFAQPLGPNGFAFFTGDSIGIADLNTADVDVIPPSVPGTRARSFQVVPDGTALVDPSIFSDHQEQLFYFERVRSQPHQPQFNINEGPFFLSPHDDPDGDGSSIWDEVFAPESHTYYDPALKIKRYTTSYVYTFTTPWNFFEDEPFGKFEFSTDLKNWSESPPPGVLIRDHTPFPISPTIEIVIAHQTTEWAPLISPSVYIRQVLPDPPLEP